METLQYLHDIIYAKMGYAFYYAIALMAVVAALAQWRLYEKAGQPGISALVPVWNIVVFLKIVGRPARDGWKLLIPIWGQLYFLPKLWIEVCQSFGKRTTLDYVLVIALNGLYILNLALSDETKYRGPVYGKQPPPPARRLSAQPSPSMA
jgi:signal peptidase I